MTVGISITNGNDAVVITDTQLSSERDRMNIAQKSEPFKGKHYHGVICGAGVAHQVLATTRIAKDLCANGDQEQPLDSFVEALHEEYQTIFRDENERQMQSRKEDLDRRQELIDDRKGRDEYVKDKLKDILRDYERMDRDDENRTQMLITAYDKGAQRIKTLGVRKFTVLEDPSSFAAVGSGEQYANSYLRVFTQGLNVKRCKQPDLLFIGMNAYNFATMAYGVGGTPRVVLVDPTGTRVLEQTESVALCNLSAHYLAETSDKLTRRRVRDHFKQTLDGKADYKAMSEETAMPEHLLKGLQVEFRAMIEYANRTFCD